MMWGLSNQGYTPEEVAETVNLVSAMAGIGETTTAEECAPSD